MALTGSSIATTYLKLLRITNDTIGTDETAYYIQDSADTASALSISTTRVGIGTATPTSALDIESNQASELAIHLNNPNAGGNSHIKAINNASSTVGLLIYGASVAAYGALASGEAALYSNDKPITIMTDGGSSYIKFATGGNTERMRIDEDGNVGIGTAAPAGKVSVVTDSDTTGAPTAYDSKHFTVGEGGTTDGNVYISYDQTNDRGYIGALSPSVAWRDLVLQVGGGNVGIGVAAPDTNLHIHKATAGSIVGDANVQLLVENSTHVGMQFLSPNNAQAQILFGDVDDGDIGFINYNHSTNALAFATNTAIGMTLDSSGDVTFAGDLIMADGKGINFAAMTSPADATGMTAEILDDYEEGTWEGAIKDTSSNAMVMDHTTGYYTKVGNLVTVSGYFNTTSVGSATNDIRIYGLPFTVVNNNAAYSGGGAAYASSLNLAAAGRSVNYHAPLDANEIYLSVWNSTSGTTAMQASEWNLNSSIIIGFSYRAA